ncbi:MAG: alpha/beta hydrolase [Candidatus Omnitrophica bacterium]|nr:alpha/beta hydrolase [Candidatus Omnitrophota bacterium]
MFAVLLALQLSGCAATSSFINRGAFCEDLAARNGFTKELIDAGTFKLLSYTRFTKRIEPVTIYIEGDGLAWKSRRCLSDDPTPKDTLVVELASVDPSENTAYLARPGQYSLSGASECESAYWSSKRFSEEVIASMNMAVDRLKRISGADKVDLVGYSGGGAIAVLVAARRNDVASIRTIAGNLDTEALNRHHGVSALTGSLNPIDYASAISKVPQRHFVGTGDKTVPAFIAESFARRAGDNSGGSVIKVEGATHNTGWREKWPELLRK